MQHQFPFSEAIEKKTHNQFDFKIIRLAQLPPIENPDNPENDSLLHGYLLNNFKVLYQYDVLKLIICTPDTNLMNGLYFGVAYLSNRNVITFQIENTPIFCYWMELLVDKHPVNAKLYEFTQNGFSSRLLYPKLAKQFYEETGAFITAFVPKLFIKEKLKIEKEKYLTPFIATTASEDFLLLKSEFNALVSHRNLEVIPPANNDKVYIDFEKESGFAIPEALQQLLLLHNGVAKTGFITLETIIEEWRSWKTIFEDYTLDELLAEQDEKDDRILPMYTTPYWIPFYKLGNGNFVAIDLAPASMGTPGQIIFIGADSETASYAAANIVEFLRLLHNA